MDEKFRIMDEKFSDHERRALAAEDPAAGVKAPAALHDRVAGMTARGESAPAARRRRWLAPLAAAAAVVAAATGGGYLWGSGGFDLGPAPAPIAVETGSPTDPAPPIGGGTMEPDSQSAGGTSNVIADSVVGWWPGRQRFIVPELEESPPRQEANVYAVDAKSRFTAEEAARIAAALGLSGEVRSDDFGWRLEGAGGILNLGSWGDVFFNNNTRDPLAACETSAHALHGEDAQAFTHELERCLADFPMPSDEFVRESLSSFLAAIGMEEDSTRITLTPSGSATVSAKAELIVEGNVTRITAEVTVSAQGIAHAWGSLGDVVSLGAYPLIGPAEAAARLSDPGFTPELVGWPAQNPDPGGYMPPTAPPAVPGAGSAIPWAIAEHEIVSVRLGLTLIHAEGVVYLVPAYEFTAKDETVWSVLAVAESALDTTATEEE